jgi:hypothetical protein
MAKDAFYNGTCPLGEPLKIPASVDRATDPYFAIQSDEDIKKYYDDNGYIVRRNLVSAEQCD